MKEIMMIRTDHLEPHPDAQAYGASRGVSDEQEDFAALKDDISKAGILSPLDVIASGEKGRWLVIDGCGRLAAARTLEIKEVPCVDAGEVKDVRVYAVSKNAMRRKLTGGERIMRFVDLHQREVAEAWKAGTEHESDGEISGKGGGGWEHVCTPSQHAAFRSVWDAQNRTRLPGCRSRPALNSD